MSLRDQLLAKGLVSKKSKQRAERELKRQRKKGQGERRRKKDVAADDVQTKAEARASRDAQRREQRQLQEVQRAASEHQQRLRQIIDGNRLGFRGPVPYRYVGPDQRRIFTCSLSSLVAELLRRGEAAVVVSPDDPEQHTIVRAQAARKLRELGHADLIAVFHEDSNGLSDPSERFLPRPDEHSPPDLRARKATREDVAAFRDFDGSS
jgi:uncharacterized protein YaiL (DUF2058 family)